MSDPRPESPHSLARPARILILDDHPIVRMGYHQLISRCSDLQVCGEAASAREAMDQILANEPDLVLVDITLTDGHGLDLLKQIKAGFPRVKTLVVSSHDEGLFAERSLQAGALGYICKHQTAEQLIEGIRTVLGGQVYLSSAMTSRLLMRNVGAAATTESSPMEKLSDRELEVFFLLGQGLTSAQIATKLTLSPKTVDRYRENIKGKLNLANSTELIRRATQWAIEKRTEN